MALSVLCTLQFSFCCMNVNVLCFIQRSLSNLFCTLLAVQVSLLEIMLKQYCPSERVINHQVDKSSGHCWRVMSVTFNTFGLLLVSWIISPPMMARKIFCVPSIKCGDYVTLLYREFHFYSLNIRVQSLQPGKYCIIPWYACVNWFFILNSERSTFTFEEILAKKKN